ncbi:hypothetical protein BH10PSE6_BH10PSE6_59650 [soil metagenome]
MPAASNHVPSVTSPTRPQGHDASSGEFVSEKEKRMLAQRQTYMPMVFDNFVALFHGLEVDGRFDCFGEGHASTVSRSRKQRQGFVAKCLDRPHRVAPRVLQTIAESVRIGEMDERRRRNACCNRARARFHWPDERDVRRPRLTHGFPYPFGWSAPQRRPCHDDELGRRAVPKHDLVAAARLELADQQVQRAGEAPRRRSLVARLPACSARARWMIRRNPSPLAEMG